MKELARKYKIEFDNEKILKPILKIVNDNLDKYFLAFRANKLMIYYRGKELVSIYPMSKNEWLIKPRKESTSKTNERIEKISNDYINKLEENGYSSKKTKMVSDKDYAGLFEITQEFVDKYDKKQEGEKSIQGEFACRYQKFHNDLLCVDLEYNQKFQNNKEKELSGIEGRYDLIMLKKINAKKYIPIFVELKSRDKACFDCNDGIINHISDMQGFLEKYKNDENSAKTIISDGIKFAVERKKAFNIIEEDISDYIDFNDAQIWILFAMTKKFKSLTPTNKEKLIDILDKEIKNAKWVKHTYDKDGSNKKIVLDMEKDPIKYNGKQIKKYELDKYPDIKETIIEYAYQNSYYDDFKKVE